jgi:hypothetical protein
LPSAEKQKASTLIAPDTLVVPEFVSADDLASGEIQFHQDHPRPRRMMRSPSSPVH